MDGRVGEGANNEKIHYGTKRSMVKQQGNAKEFVQQETSKREAVSN
jgi:hypothetical protein